MQLLTIEDAQAAVNSMDLPVYKMDLGRDSNVLWLVENLRTRNLKHKDFFDVQCTLISLAETRHLLKKSVLMRHKNWLFDQQAPTNIKQAMALGASQGAVAMTSEMVEAHARMQPNYRHTSGDLSERGTAKAQQA